MVWLGAIAGYLMAGYLLEQTSFEIVFAIGGLLCVFQKSSLYWVIAEKKVEESLA